MLIEKFRDLFAPADGQFFQPCCPISTYSCPKPNLLISFSRHSCFTLWYQKRHSQVTADEFIFSYPFQCCHQTCPSAAVVANFATAAGFTNSPVENIFFKWRLIPDLSIPNSNAIWSMLSQTLSLTRRTFNLVVPSGA